MIHIFPQDSRCYGCGTTYGTFNKVRYFTCPDNNGLLLSLATVAKQPEWLKLEYHPNTDGMQKDDNITPIPAKRSIKETPQASALPNMEVNRTNVDTKKLPHGTRVFIRTKGGRKVNGTVRWAGDLPLEGEDPKKKIPVYGLETVSLLLDDSKSFTCTRMIAEFSLCSSHFFVHSTLCGWPIG